MTTSISEVKYSILGNFNTFNSFNTDDEFIIAISLSVNGGNQNILIINFAGDIDLTNNIYNYFNKMIICFYFIFCNKDCNY